MSSISTRRFRMEQAQEQALREEQPDFETNGKVPEPIQDVELDRGMLEGLLRPYVNERAERDNHGKMVERYAALLKNYLERHEGEEIVDGEHGITAKLQQRGGGDAYDIQNAPAELVLLLHSLNLLTVNVAGVKAQGGGSEAYERLKTFKVPGRGSVALIVEEKR